MMSNAKPQGAGLVSVIPCEVVVGNAVMVPRQPTYAMLDDAVRELNDDLSFFDAERLWAAMLAAAPPAAPSDEVARLIKILEEHGIDHE